MAYQFIHVETYARTPAKNSKTRASAAAVFAEARREAGYCDHVASPRPPVRVYGQPLDRTETEVAALAAAARDKRGRPLRKDAPVLIAGVASYPTASADLIKAAPDERERYKKWKDATLQFLKNEYGDSLKTVILHVDEKYPHLHFYVVPELKPDLSLNVGDLHRGKRAQLAAPEALRMKAYKTAMREFQDDYQAVVGQACGLTRRGPGRRRLTREAWLAEKQQAEELSKKIKENNRIKQQAGQLVSQERARAQAELERAQQQLAEVQRDLERWKNRAKDAELHFDAILREKMTPVLQTAELPGLDNLKKPDTPSY